MVKEKSEYVRYDISIDGKKTFVYDQDGCQIN